MRTDSSPSLISISAMPDSSSSSMSFLTLRISITSPLVLCPLLAGGREMVSGSAQRQLVADRAEPGDRAHGDVRKMGVMTEALACVHVAQVHFDERDLHRQQRVAQRNARMRERGRVE